MPPVTVWSVLDRYGLPLFLLIIVLWFIYKIGWPAFNSQLDISRKVLEAQLDKAQERLESSNKEFLRALERRDAILEKGLGEIRDSLNQMIHRPRVPRKDK